MLIPELDNPSLGFCADEFKWLLVFVIDGTKRDNVGVLQGDGDVWRLSLGSDPLVIILLNEQINQLFYIFEEKAVSFRI